jgi:hypothetical protein
MTVRLHLRRVRVVAVVRDDEPSLWEVRVELRDFDQGVDH